MGKTKVAKDTGNTKKSKLSYEEKRAFRASQEAAKSNSVEPVTQKSEDVQTAPSLKSPMKVERAGEKPTAKTQEAGTHGKKYKEAKAKLEEDKVYSISEGAKLVKETSYSKFPGSVELHLVVEAEKNVNQTIELPYSSGVSKKVEIMSDDTLKKLESGKIDFDVLIAAPSQMAKLVPFAKLLGPRGLMPNPKNGTLIDNPEKAKGSFGGKSVQLKTEKSAPLIHLVIAKVNQPEAEIVENTKAVLSAIGQKSVVKAVLSASMGPGIQVQVA